MTLEKAAVVKAVAQIEIIFTFASTVFIFKEKINGWKPPVVSPLWSAFWYFSDLIYGSWLSARPTCKVVARSYIKQHR